MATGLINITIKVTGTYSDVLHVFAYPASNPLVSDANIDVEPPFDNPQSISLVVPTLEAHFIKILDVDNNLVAFNVINYEITGGEDKVSFVIYNFKAGTGNAYPGSNTFISDTAPYDFRGKKILIFTKGGTPLAEGFSFEFDSTLGKFTLTGDQWGNEEIGSIVGA